MTILHLFSAAGGYALFNNEMLPVLPRNISLNLMVNEVNKFNEGKVIVYYINPLGRFQMLKVISFNTSNPFDGNIT